MNKKRGFTLIELLVVIAIIGMLSAIVLASLNTARSKARDAARVAQVKQFQTAVELYYSDNGAYPGDQNWYDNDCAGYSEINPLMVGYITLPADPGGSCIQYTGKNGYPGIQYLIYVVPENPEFLGGNCYDGIPNTPSVWAYCLVVK